MRYYVTIRGATAEVEIEPDGVRIDGEPVDVSTVRIDGTPVYSMLVDGASHRVVARPRGKGVWDLHVRGRHALAEVIDERTRAIREMAGVSAGAAGPTLVRAPMPGLVVKVEVAEGDQVEAGQGLLIVEAMKMENELTADVKASVGTIHVSPGQTVEKDQILMDLVPPDGEQQESV